ncbi:MAG TPA: DUF1207 domain-containing protein [Ignavibacteriaceae bacterium]|nr:DUF1207 domain-containing protein [Ignavibacteriaceae bacterium]
MRFVLVMIIISFIKLNSLAQTTSEWFPADLNIQPFTAHFLEPKTGFQYLFDIEKVRIDIGTSHDIIHWNNEDESFSFGADFFTYTRARSENNFKFPVETVDYLFGVNGSYKKKNDGSEWGARLRFSHISAHLVDGYYEAESESWLNGREPFVYSREFFELIAYYKIFDIRVYGGVTYNIHIVPDEIKKGILQAGFDYYVTQIETSFFTPFIAYDFKLTGIDEYSGNNIVSAGVKFGQPESRGFSILASYFSGKSVHGEFYNVNESYATIGINLDI